MVFDDLASISFEAYHYVLHFFLLSFELNIKKSIVSNLKLIFNTRTT